MPKFIKHYKEFKASGMHHYIPVQQYFHFRAINMVTAFLMEMLWLCLSTFLVFFSTMLPDMCFFQFAQIVNMCSFSHMKITASVTERWHQDCGHAIYYLYTYSHSLLENKKLIWWLFSLANYRPQTTVQWCILQHYSWKWIGFDVISKCHTLSIVYTVLVKIC